MMASSVILLVVYVGLAVVVVGCANGRIGINAVAGIRTANTMANEQTWLAAHRAARTPTIIGIVAAVISLAPAFFGGSEPEQTLLVVLSVALLMVGVIVGTIVGTRAARAVLASQEHR